MRSFQAGFEPFPMPPGLDKMKAPSPLFESFEECLRILSRRTSSSLDARRAPSA